MTAILAALLSFPGCGGGGGGSSPGEPPAYESLLVEWKQPNTYTDNTLLDLSLDIEFYEVVAFDNVAQLEPWEERAFPDNVITYEFPLPIALVAGVDNDWIPVQSITIGLFGLEGIVSAGDVFVTVRSTTHNGAISRFGAGAYIEEAQE